MKRGRLAVLVPFATLAALATACRAIVGITDLAVDAGADAALDHAHPDVHDAAHDHSEGATPDATPDANPDAKPDGRADAASDAPTADVTSDASDAQPVSCDAPSLPPDASAGRAGCVSGCVMGHSAAATAFYSANMACSCMNCGAVCESFCSRSCIGVVAMGACSDCLSHAYIDDGGACHAFEDTMCKAGCDSFAICVSECPAE